MTFSWENLIVGIFIISLSLCITISGNFSSIAIYGADTQTPAFEDDYASDAELIAENDKFSLYINKITLNTAIVDKTSGITWYSSPTAAPFMEEKLSGVGRLMAASQLYVGYINAKSRTTGSVNSQLGSVKQKTAKYKKIKNGLRITYDFSRATDGFEIPIEITLTMKGFDARIDYKNIREYGENLITDITLLPNFGSVLKGENGFLFVPDGSGSIINFDSAKASSKVFSQPVYGRDTAYSLIQDTAPAQSIHLPIFGMSKKNSGFITIIDKGSATATINAFPSGVGSEFNYINASFTYRGIDNVVLSDASWISKNVVLFAKTHTLLDSVGVSYRFIKENSLTGMANEYRDYLIENNGLTKISTSETSLYLELYGGIKKKKSFLGIILNTIVPMTDFTQAEEILRTMKDSGIGNIIVKYNGVLKGGIDNAAVINTKLEKALGGNRAFAELLTYANDNDIEIYPDFEFQKIYKNRFMWWSFSYASKMLSQSPIAVFEYRKSTFFRDMTKSPAYLMMPHKLNNETDEFCAKFNLEGVAGISSGSMGNLLYSDFSANKFYDRQMSADNVSANLAKLAEKTGSVLVTSGFDYAALEAQHIYSAPMSDSMFDITSYSVPFYSMVFHGYKDMGSESLNMGENPWIQFLSCIEQGINPSFTFTYLDGNVLENTSYNYLICTYFRNWTETAAKYYKAYKELYQFSANEQITDYRIVSRDVRIVTYANGLTVCVNYSDENCIVENIIVKAENYAVIHNIEA